MQIPNSNYDFTADVVLKVVSIEDGIALDDCSKMFSLLETQRAFPVDVVGNFNMGSAAIGFMSELAADCLDYDYGENSHFAKFIDKEVLSADIGEGKLIDYDSPEGPCLVVYVFE